MADSVQIDGISPTLEKRRHVEENVSSIGWFDLPFEKRKIIIDRMDPKTRCRFAQCSKKCEKEAKISKNYLYGIAVDDKDRNLSPEDAENTEAEMFQLSFIHYPESKRDYWLEFMDGRDGYTIVAYRYYSSRFEKNRLAWTKVELGRPKKVRFQYLTTYLKKYEHCIRRFENNDEAPSLQEFNIRNLRRLESFSVKNEAKELGTFVDNVFIDVNQFASLNHLESPMMYYTIEEFSKFNGKIATISFDDFDNETVEKYLKMLKNGECHQNLVKFTILGISYDDEDIDIDNFTKDLNVFDFSENDDDMDDDDFCCNFSFHSNVRDDGKFKVEYKVENYDFLLEIRWEDTEVSI